MSKKTERITFRTSEENMKYLQEIQEVYDFPVGNTIHRMIEYFVKEGDTEKTFEKLTVGKPKRNSVSIWKHTPRR
jgi:hypothetical protein